MPAHSIETPTMTTTGNQAPWLELIEENIAETDNVDIYNGNVDKIMKSFLLSRNPSLAKDTAHQLDKFYWEKHIPAYSEPAEYYQPNQQMAAFLEKIYNLIFELASMISRDDIKHEMLLQLLLELRKLPGKSFVIDGKDCQAYINDPMLSDSIEEVYRGRYVSNYDAKFSGFDEKTSDFLNLTSFLALCFQNGIDADNDYRYKYLEIDLADSLEQEVLEPGVVRDFRVRVATNYLLKAGQAIYEDFIKKNEEKRRGKWEVWATRLSEYREMYEKAGDAAMASLAGKAYDKMKGIDPSV